MIMKNFKDFVRTIPAEGKCLGVDWGLCRTGIAISDITQEFAFPKAVISGDVFRDKNGVKKTKPLDTDFLISKIKNIIDENKIIAIIIGLPTYIDGTYSDTTIMVQQFAEILEKKIDLPIAFVDETLSSMDASEKLGKKSKNNDIDSYAATVILSDGLAKIKREKNNDS